MAPREVRKGVSVGLTLAQGDCTLARSHVQGMDRGSRQASITPLAVLCPSQLIH